MLYTAQYRYPGRDRVDVTVKGNDVVGKFFAPSWEIVMGHKKGIIDDAGYSNTYFPIIIDRYNTIKEAREVTLNIVKMVRDQGRDLTLVCFCPSNAFCHRHLLARYFEHNWQVPLGGERKLK